MPKIRTTKAYEKRLRRFKKEHPEMRDRYVLTLSLLQANPRHPSLRLHKLKGSLAGLSSVSINMQYRIVLDFIIRDDQIILIDIGSHDGVY